MVDQSHWSRRAISSHSFHPKRLHTYIFRPKSWQLRLYKIWRMVLGDSAGVFSHEQAKLKLQPARWGPRYRNSEKRISPNKILDGIRNPLEVNKMIERTRRRDERRGYGL